LFIGIMSFYLHFSTDPRLSMNSASWLDALRRIWTLDGLILRSGWWSMLFMKKGRSSNLFYPSIIHLKETIQVRCDDIYVAIVKSLQLLSFFRPNYVLRIEDLGHIAVP
jgi:hypothetical protein